MSDKLKEKQIQRVVVEESKTIVELLLGLKLSPDFVVLVDWKRVHLEIQIYAKETVGILLLMLVVNRSALFPVCTEIPV
jgi:hypothetical protein